MPPSEAPVEIVPYDAAWPLRFEEEARHLRVVLRPWLAGSIEHIGSTAVPGLPAKPVIDIMAAVEDLDTSRPAIDALAGAAYCYAPYRAQAEHWFCKPSPIFRTHHLHLVPAASRQWRDASISAWSFFTLILPWRTRRLLPATIAAGRNLHER